MFQSLNQLEFKFREVQPGTAVTLEQPCKYNGPVGLKEGVAESFGNPFECLAQNGLDRSFVARLARNSNECARKFILPKDRNRRLHGHDWRNITVSEMYVFLGITLRISLSPMDSGGYAAYFRKSNKVVMDVIIYGTKGFAHKYMKMWRYKQIRAALHPDDRKAASMDGTDKAFMLRHALNTLNTAASNVMHMSGELTFDEGGTASRHRRNPIRQFNGAKPQKFRIDYFLLTEAKSYFIHHADVHQGKNASEVNIHKEVHGVPTTQKVVLNAVLQTKMHECVDGARHITLDNRYQCPQLATLMLKRYDIDSTGTSRLARKGWDKSIFNLKKSRPKGTLKMAVDEDNGILCLQWVDSKVVQVISTKINTQIGEVLRQQGSKKEAIPCPEAIIHYQNHMYGVDKGDQIRSHGGGFSAKAHYKKWYKKGFFAILDMMLMNTLISWNTAAKDNPQLALTVMSRHDLYWYVAQRMLNYTEELTLHRSPEKQQAGSALARGHKPEKCGPKSTCAVCKLDWNLVKKKNLGKDPPKAGLTSDVARCMDCAIMAHDRPCTVWRSIHSLPEFKDLTCFEIAHTTKGFDIWHRSKEPIVNVDEKKRSYNPKTAHPTYLELAKIIGAAPKKRGSTVASGESGSTTNNTVQARTKGSITSSSDDGSSSDEEPRPMPLRLTDVPECNNNGSTQ